MRNQSHSKMLSYAFRKNAVSKIISAESGTIASVIDSIIISKCLGLDAMGAYGIAMPVIYLIIAFAKLLSDGSAKLCGTSIGKGERKETDSVYSTTIVSTMLLAVGLMVVLLIAPKEIAKLLGANGTAENYLNGAVDFLRGYAWGIPGHMLLLTLIPFAQLDGKLSLVSKAGYSMAIVDILLDIANVYIFRYGLWGMAFATALSEYVGAVILCLALFRKNTEFHFSIRLFNPKFLIKLRWYGIPGFLSYFFTSARSVVSNYAIITFLPIWILPIFNGVSSLMNLFYPVAKGIGSTVMVMSSISYGEKDKKGLKQLLSISNVYTIIVNAVLTIVIVVLAPLLLRIFLTISPDEMAIASHGARIIALSLVPFSIHTIYRNYMQGIGKILQTTLFLAMYECVVSAASVYVLSDLYSVEGFWLSFVVREIITLIVIFGFLLILNKTLGKNSAFKNTLLLLFGKFGINENESFEASIYQADELDSFIKNTENLFGNDDKISDITEYINNIGNAVFSRAFPDKQIPELRIRIYKEDEIWTIHFRDNGIRFDPTEENKLANCNAKYIRSLNQNVLILQLV